MAGNSDNKKPLSGENLTAYERWELPVIDEKGNEFPAESFRVKPLTAADLEKIHDEAFTAGREAGEAEGKTAGHKAGFAKGSEEGKKQGYDAGFSTGRNEAFAAAKGEIKESQARLAELMQALLDPIRKSEDKIEEALLNLTLAISRAVICRELNSDSSHISLIVKEALALLPEVATQVRLFIHPKDEAAVREVVSKAELAARIVATTDIHPGGCKVETSNSLIDFTVEKRFQKTVQQILESVGQKSTVDEAPDLTDAMEDMTNFHRELLDVPPLEKPEERSPKTSTTADPVKPAKLEPRVEPEVAPGLGGAGTLTERATQGADVVADEFVEQKKPTDKNVAQVEVEVMVENDLVEGEETKKSAEPKPEDEVVSAQVKKSKMQSDVEDQDD